MLYGMLASGLLALALWGAGIGKLNRRGDLFRLASLAVISVAGAVAAFTWVDEILLIAALFLGFGGFWYLFLYQSYQAEKGYRDFGDSHRHRQ